MATHPPWQARPETTPAELKIMTHTRVDERGRWSSAARTLEFNRTMRVLANKLEPRSQLLVLGVSRNPYTSALAHRGHQVTLLCTQHQALEHTRRELKERNLQDCAKLIYVTGLNALPLASNDDFDAVLMFEPFLHLLEASQRSKLAAESVRALREEGHIILHFFPPASGYIRALKLAEAYPNQINEASIERVFDSHILRSDNPGAGLRFKPEFYISLAEINELFEPLGVRCLDAQSLNSIAARHESAFLELGDESPRIFEVCRDLLEQTSREPDIIATGGRASWVGQKIVRN